MTFLHTIGKSLLDLVFPVYCIVCGGSGQYICFDCLRESPPAEREGLPWVSPLFDYRHPPIKKALWLLKYKNKRKLAQTFAEIIYGKIIEELSDLRLMENFREPLLIAIPLSKTRQRERGYNQSELIAKELVKLDKNANFMLANDILIKIKDVEHQARIRSRNERLKNIVGTFAVQPGKENIVTKRNIILIDDILTTGATLSEAKKILKAAGTRKVIAFTVAH